MKEPFQPLKINYNAVKGVKPPVVCENTLSRALKNMNIRARRPTKKPRLTEDHRVNRVNLCTKFALFDNLFWRNVIFSDEKKFKRVGADGNMRVWREPNTLYDDQNTINTNKFHGGEGVMVWAAISYSGKIWLRFPRGKINSGDYVGMLGSVFDEIENEFSNGTFIFQQDGAPIHTSQETRKWFDENNVELLECAAQSPDLNIIENLWSSIKRKMGNYVATSREYLISRIQSATAMITKEEIMTLFLSIPTRCKAIIDVKGRGTKY